MNCEGTDSCNCFIGEINNDKKNKLLKAKFVVNDQEYALTTGATVSGDGSVRKYHPVFEYKAPESSNKQGLLGRQGAKQQKHSYTVTGKQLLAVCVPKMDSWLGFHLVLVQLFFQQV